LLALVLIEAKAHATELNLDGKPLPKRKERDQQERSEKNHARIACAICRANSALQSNVPGILLVAGAGFQLGKCGTSDVRFGCAP
jgi:hypothetical protein